MLCGGDAEQHRTLGLLQKQSGDPAGALDSYRRSLALRPDVGVTYFNYGNALNPQNVADREAAYRTAKTLDPTLGVAYANLAHTLGQLKREAEAED